MKAKATAKVLTMTRILSPPKKKTQSKGKHKHKKERRRSQIIVEDFDSKKITDITDIVTHDPSIENE